LALFSVAASWQLHLLFWNHAAWSTLPENYPRNETMFNIFGLLTCLECCTKYGTEKQKGAQFVPLLSWIGCDGVWRLTGKQCFQRFPGVPYTKRRIAVPARIVPLTGHIFPTKIKRSDFSAA